jgi:hypothetical protein
VYSFSTALAQQNTATPSASNVTSAIGVYLQQVVYGDGGGTAWVLNAGTLATAWSYPNANSSAIGGTYYDNRLRRIYYGDAAGKMYVVAQTGSTVNGAALGGYPYAPTWSTDAITVPPVNVVGITVYGTSGGRVVFVDAQNASNTVALVQLYNVGSPVSAISYNYQSSTLGNYMVATADGHLYFFRRDTSDATTIYDTTTPL